jgi:creatinine amidohydrolase
MPVPAGGLMEQMTWVEVREAAAADLPVVLAMGSTEQHGPHLPLNTDCVIPVGIALETAKRLPLVVAPPIRFGARSRPLSGGGEGFAGTLSLRATTLMQTLQEVLEALARTGFRRICVQNWHYENAAYLWEPCDLAAVNHPGVRILVLEDPMPRFSAAELAELYPGGFPGWDVEHASIMETSLMEVLAPGAVRRELVADDEAARRPSWDVVPPPEDFIPRSGVLWHPTEATREIGQRFLEACSTRLEEALRTEFGLTPAREP